MNTNSINFRYLVFSNGSYLDLHDGRFFNTKKNTYVVARKARGPKLTPKELSMLKLLVQNKDTYISTEELDTVLNSTPGKEASNVHKRILNIRTQLSDYCCDHELAEEIIKVDKDNPVSKLKYYGFFLNDQVILSNEPVFTVLKPDPGENPQKAKERQKIDALADQASSDSKLGRLQEALDNRKLVYQWRRENLGEEHEDTVRAMANLATSYNKLKMYDEALRLRQTVLAIREKTCDPSSDLLRKAKKNLAVTLNSIGGHENLLKAEKLRKEIAEMLNKQ